MGTKTTNDILSDLITINHAIDKLEIDLESDNFSDEGIKKLQEYYSDFLELSKENKEALKQKINWLIYFNKQKEQQIETNKDIIRDLQSRNKTAEKSIGATKSLVLEYCQKYLGINEKNIRTDFYTLFLKVTKDSLDIPNDKLVPFDLQKEKITRLVNNDAVREYIKEHGNQDWGSMGTKISLVVKGGKKETTEEL